jgi:hypothetical protein
MKIAIACCRRSAGSAPDVLEFDADAAPLQSALSKLGVSSSLVSWDDPSTEWATFSKVVVSSTWDSVDRPEEYLAWARAVDSSSVLINSFSALEWGLDKTHQRDLAALGVPTIPTVWAEPGEVWESPPPFEFVVKPSISAGGRSTARYGAGDRSAIDHVDALQHAGQTVMIQPFLPAIDVEGELDLVFIRGELSHAVVKDALLHKGRRPPERPWEEMTWSGLSIPSSEQRDVGDRTMAAVTTLLGRCPAYCRVDLINDVERGPVLLEVELIDPYLSLDENTSAAALLAETICGA